MFLAWQDDAAPLLGEENMVLMDISHVKRREKFKRRTRELLQLRANTIPFELQKIKATTGHFMSSLVAPDNLTAPSTFSAGSRCKNRFVI
jgi:hypothetical protein